MSIARALNTGVTGLSVEGETLGTIGDNIANVNTVGFKTQRTIFADILGSSITSGNSGSQAGSGARLLAVQQLFTQGALSSTGIATDVALSGPGFFVVRGSVEGMTGNFYTRAGQFRVDESGNLVNAEQLRVQGYAVQPDGTLAASVSDVKVPTGTLPAHATSQMTLAANLASYETTPTLPWNAQDPGATSNVQSSITVYDSLGNAHALEVCFRKTAANTWDYHILANSAEVQGGTGTFTEIGSGAVSFTTNGALNTVTTGVPATVSFLGAAPGQAIALSLGSTLAGGGTGLDGTTQFAAPSNTSSESQDGYGSGEITGLSFRADGMVSASYTNGQKRGIAQLAVAKFRAEEGLGRAGHSLWVETKESGQGALGGAGSGGRGSVTAGVLEQSNVDLAQQFVDLIAHQRGFQADSKTIQAADEMLQGVVNLKR